MDFKKMEAFVAVASTGKFTDAAEQLLTSQSALSKQVGRLEDELGVELFSKTRNGVELTQAGWDFYGYARQALRTYQDATNRLHGYSSTSQQKLLRFGCLPLAQEYNIEDAVVSYWTHHTNVQVDFKERSQDSLLKSLGQGILDLALLRLDLLDKTKFEAEPLLADELVLVCPSTHPIAREHTVDLASLKNTRFILLEQKSDITQRFVQECKTAGFFPNAPLYSSRHRMVLKAVQARLGLTVMPKRMVEALLAADLVTVPFRGSLFTTMGFVWARSQRLSATAVEFKHEMREGMRNMGSLSYNILEQGASY